MVVVVGTMKMTTSIMVFELTTNESAVAFPSVRSRKQRLSPPRIQSLSSAGEIELAAECGQESL